MYVLSFTNNIYKLILLTKGMTKRGKGVSHITKNVPEKKVSLEKSLAENLIALQKINVDLSEKFDKLAHEISQLLALFEIAARNFAKNVPGGEYEKDKEFLDKIDKLLEQNKVLAKGMTLVEERLRKTFGCWKAPAEILT